MRQQAQTITVLHMQTHTRQTSNAHTHMHKHKHTHMHTHTTRVSLLSLSPRTPDTSTCEALQGRGEESHTQKSPKEEIHRIWPGLRARVYTLGHWRPNALPGLACTDRQTDRQTDTTDYDDELARRSTFTMNVPLAHKSTHRRAHTSNC